MLLDKLAHVLRTEANAPSKTDAMKLTPGDQAVEASRRYAQKLNDLEPVRTNQITNSIFTTYIIPFEVVGVLLLGALIGAVLLARKD